MRLLRQLFGIWTHGDLQAFHKAVFGSCSNAELFASLANFRSTAEFVQRRCAEQGFRLLQRQLPGAARIAAAEIHTKGCKLLARSSATHSSEHHRRAFLFVHAYAWGQSLAEEVQAQANGRFSQPMRDWLRDERRFDVDFNVLQDFDRLFASGPDAIYSKVEQLSAVVPGALYELIQAET